MLYPGCRKFYFGNMLDMIDYSKVRAGTEVVTGPQNWLIFNHFPKVMGFPEGKRFEANEYPMVVCNSQSVPSIWVSDPEIV